MSTNPTGVMRRFISALAKYNNRNECGLNMAVRKASNGRFWTYKEFYNSFFNTISKVRSKGTSFVSFAKTYCGMDFKNSDTGSISGYEAG